MFNRDQDIHISNYQNATPPAPANGSSVVSLIFPALLLIVACVVFAKALDGVALLAAGLVTALSTIITALFALVGSALPWIAGIVALVYVAGLVTEILPDIMGMMHKEQAHRHAKERAMIMMTAPRPMLLAQNEQAIGFKFVRKEVIER